MLDPLDFDEFAIFDLKNIFKAWAVGFDADSFSETENPQTNQLPIEVPITN